MCRINRHCLAQCLPLSFLWLVMTTVAHAETLQATIPLSPANEFPPVTNLTATGNVHLTVELTRDADGNLTSAKMSLRLKARCFIGYSSRIQIFR